MNFHVGSAFSRTLVYVGSGFSRTVATCTWSPASAGPSRRPPKGGRYTGAPVTRT